MKTVCSSVLMGVMCSMILSQACSAAATDKGDEAAVAAEAMKLFKITAKATRRRSAAVENVMGPGAALYDVTVRIAGPDEGASISELKVIKAGGAVTPICAPSTNQPCPELQKLIKKRFTLKTEQDAKAVEAVLDALYPISDSFGGRDKKAKKIVRTGNGFTFVRGEFFKALKGFLFETDANGSIVRVSHSLEIKR